MAKEKWRSIYDAIDGDIRTGVLQPGDQLPPEPVLAQSFGAGRHSVRRAIAELAKDGKLSVEQGRGTFVEEVPEITYTIGRRTRLGQNLQANGADLSRDRVGGGTEPASARVAEALALAPGSLVIRDTRLSRVGEAPISYGSTYYDAVRFPDFLERRQVLGSVTATYRSYGISDYFRQETALHSRRARGDEAKRLRQHPDQPVMVVQSVDVDLAGRPIGFNLVIWSSVRVRFVIPLETGVGSVAEPAAQPGPLPESV